MFDFSNLYLEQEEKDIIKKFKRNNRAILTIQEFNRIKRTGLIKGAMGGHSDWFDINVSKGICELSEKGIRFREYQKIATKTQRRAKSAHIQSWIAIAISLIALILSIVLR